MATSLLLLPLAAPLLTAAAGAVWGWRRATAQAGVAAAAVLLGIASALAVATTTTGRPVTAWGGTLRADALSAVMLLVIGLVGTLATWSGVRHVTEELRSGQASPAAARRYAALVPAFLATMAFTVLTDNLGLLWAGVEATTIVTAFLVGHRGGRRALEATWKYVVIGSVGIALAYLGTVLAYYAARHAGIPAADALRWSSLVGQAGQLDPSVLRVALVLLVLGFGTKAGLVPLHSWLPDAHGQAPAPVSALMSGVLLPVAAYALLRYRVVAVAALGTEFPRLLLLTVALLSLVLAASLLLVQHDLKRMLAYSSIEHMGLVALGIAVGTPLAVAALLLHVVGHGLAKAVLFCGSGRLLALEGTTALSSVRGLVLRRPALGAAVALGLAALLGLPPFSLFASEVALLRAVVGGGLGWAAGVTLLLLLAVFGAMVVRLAPLLLGPADPVPAPEGAGTGTGAAPLLVGLAALVVLGMSAWPLEGLLRAAAGIVGTP